MGTGKTSAVTSFPHSGCCRELHYLCYNVPACLSPVGAQMLTRGIIICCNILLWNFPFFGTVVEVFFFLPTHPSFSTAVRAAGKFKPDGFEDNDRRGCNVCVMWQRHSCADRCCCAFQQDETCWTLPGVSPHGLFLEMAHWVHCATINTHCCALHFFPCMVMRFLRCSPFSWRGRRISFWLF